MSKAAVDAELRKRQVLEMVAGLKPVAGHKDAFIEHRTRVVPRISTGFLSLDIALNGGMTNELYIMAAETSTGKSALMMALAQNIAKQGINVLYYSMEMGADEFVARAISSISLVAHTRNETKPLFTAGDVLYWRYDNAMSKFVRVPYASYESYAEEYFKVYGDRLFIVEAGPEGMCAKDIANVAAVFRKSHPKEQVVVFIDYLQILKADPFETAQNDRKTKIDVAVTMLKSLASQIGMPVFTVSSISRENYNKRTSTAAFKESGDTEYTGGVLIGWNWHGVTDESDAEKSRYERELCNKRGYRKMEFNVLKYRNAQRDHGVRLLYYPAYSYFVDEYSFHPDIEKENPFSSWDDFPEAEDGENDDQSVIF